MTSYRNDLVSGATLDSSSFLKLGLFFQNGMSLSENRVIPNEIAI